MPRFDELERHALLVSAAPAKVHAALERTDLRRYGRGQPTASGATGA